MITARDLHAAALLAASAISRFLREALVLRSLVWPLGLTASTMVVTLILVAWARGTTAIAVPPTLEPSLVAALEAQGWPMLRDAIPRERVTAGDAWAATDGERVWITREHPDLARLEATLREHRRATWRPDPAPPVTPASVREESGALLCRTLGLLFTLYGLVFGMGSVARDRDDGTLDAELTLPIGRWVAGLSRWIAATSVLTCCFGLSVAIFDAFLGVAEPGALTRHGYAATGGAAALGVAAMGTAGLKRGFSGPLALGITAVTAMASAGLTGSPLARIMPISSLWAGGSGWEPALLTTAAGLTSAVVFAIRSGRG